MLTIMIIHAGGQTPIVSVMQMVMGSLMKLKIEEQRKITVEPVILMRIMIVQRTVMVPGVVMQYLIYAVYAVGMVAHVMFVLAIPI